ncbi:MAG: DUF5686 family protein [Rhodothermales bacterium]|nr:DUF5686 family protein [Rhodothermales bacterium]
MIDSLPSTGTPRELPACRTSDALGRVMALGMILVLVTSAANAQVLLHGVVVDTQTGETLPAASIQIEGTLRGTISNAEGLFTIEADSLPVDLVVRYIGYAPARSRVAQADNIRLALRPMVYQLEEVVVSGAEDPAVRIMREVIRRKQVWRAELETYGADAYNRFTMRNDTGIVSVVESVSKAYWRRDGGMREIVMANRQTNNMQIDQYLPAARFMANFYDDNLDIAGYDFPGVTHPDAFRHYTFTLVGSWRQGDDTVFDIKVEPRNRLKTAFVGRLSVLDGVFAMLDVELTPGESFLFPPPIQNLKITYSQQFADFDGAFWLPVDLRARILLDIAMMRLLALPTIEINQVTRLTNYATNVATPDSLFGGEKEVVVDSASVQTSNLLDLGVVRVNVASGGATPATDAATDSTGIGASIVPLTRAEAAAYDTIDSTMTLEKAYKPTGAMARFIKDDDEDKDGGEGGDGKGRKGLGIAFKPALHYNRAEGVYAGALLERTLARTVTIRAGAGYGTASPEGGEGLVSYRGGLSVVVKETALHADYIHGTTTVQGAEPLALTANGLVMLLGGHDYYDYYRRDGFELSLTTRKPAQDLAFSAGLTAMNLRRLTKAVDFNLFGYDRGLPENPNVLLIDAGPGAASARSALWSTIRYGDDDQTFGVTGRRSVELGVEWSQPGFLDSQLDYARYWLDAEWQLPTFFQRRILSNRLHLRTVAFTTRGDTPLWTYGALDSRMGVVSPFGRFKTLPGRPYMAPSGAALFWEHNFRTVFFEMLGWHDVARKGYGIIVFGGHGKTWGEEATTVFAYGPMYGANDHHEVGLSLSGLFSLFRLDAAFRLDKPGFTIGLGAARLF